MKMPDNSLRSLVLKAAFGLVTLLFFSVFAGCATDRKPPVATLSDQDFRILYPREYYESSPSERQELEREDAWEKR